MVLVRWCKGMIASFVRSMPSALLFITAITACGGSTPERTVIDESRDFSIIEERTSAHLAGTVPVGPEISGSQWEFKSAHCTDGDLDLSGRGFSRITRATADTQGLILVHDDTWVSEGGSCLVTTAQRAIPGSELDAEWSMREDARVQLGACDAPVDEDRPGDVRRRGNELEVYVQRSSWCNGFEARMVYTPVQPTAISDERIPLHYAVHFNRQDATRITQIFAPSGSLVDPFTRTELDQAVRFDGQQAVYDWFTEAFNATPWVALRVVSLEETAPGLFVMDYHYMDPRLEAPFVGRNRFTVATGEIFETSIEILSNDAPELEDGAPAAAFAGATSTPAALQNADGDTSSSEAEQTAPADEEASESTTPASN